MYEGFFLRKLSLRFSSPLKNTFRDSKVLFLAPKRQSKLSNDDMAKAASPEPRCDHESALVGDKLHLFGGRKGKFTNYHYLISFFLGPSNESYMQIETQILSSAKLISIVPQNEPQDTEKLERELEHLRYEFLHW